MNIAKILEYLQRYLSLLDFLSIYTGKSEFMEDLEAFIEELSEHETNK